MPPLIEPLDVVVTSQKTVSRFQFPPEQVHKVPGKVAPPVVDLAHDDVSCTFGGKARRNVGTFSNQHVVSFFFLAALTELDVGAGLATLVSVEDQ